MPYGMLSDDFWQLLAALQAMQASDDAAKEETIPMATLSVADLVAAVERERTVASGVLTMVQGLLMQITPLLESMRTTDRPATDSLIAQLAGLLSNVQQNAQPLADAVVANTPAAVNPTPAADNGQA